jgi:heterodisulfide reductase subunit B
MVILEGLRKTDIEKNTVSYSLPVLYITELVGLALGIKPRALGLDKHIVSTRPVLNKLDL